MKIILLLSTFIIAMSGSTLWAVDWYVDANNGRDDNTGVSSNAAKKTLAAVFAIEGIKSGDIVHAAPGNYNAGAMWDGALSNRVMVSKGVGLVADEGRAVTTITGAPDPSTGGNGANAVRCVYLESKAWIKGFKITGGYVAGIESTTDKSCFSGGVYVLGSGVSAGAVVECELTGNSGYRGSAIYHGTLIRSYVHDNTTTHSVYGCDYVISSVITGADSILGNHCYNNSYLATKVSGSPYLAVNSYIKTDGGKMAYTNCVLGSTKLATSSIGELNLFGQTPSVESNTFRPTRANSVLHDAGDRLLYDTYFPSEWKQFKESFDFAGGARIGGTTIDIGAGEFQEPRIEQGPSRQGTLFNLQGLRMRPPRKVAVVGEKEEIKALAETAMQVTRVVHDDFLPATGGVPVTDYKKYVALFMVCDANIAFSDEARWNTPARLAAVRAYLREGGLIVLGNKAVTFFETESEEAWKLVHSGRVIVIDRGIYELQKYYNDNGIKLGEADEVGNWAMTAEGEYLDNITRSYVEVCENLTDSQVCRGENEGIDEWGLEPLGGRGARTEFNTVLPNPSYINTRLTKMYDYPAGVVLYDETSGLKAKIVTISSGEASKIEPESGKSEYEEYKKLANEIKYHLDRMTGQAFEVVEATPSEGPYIRLANDDTMAYGAVSIETTEDERGWVISASERIAVSRAVTFLLESLGCRYLWPGVLGKVIPKNQTYLAVPQVTFKNMLPKFEYRRWGDAYLCGGKVAVQIKDDANNRNYNHWFALNSSKPYATGHYFGEFYKKYYKDHPEWFALQNDGVRHLVSGKEDRSVLCLSNEELRKEAARVIASEMGTATPEAPGTLTKRYHVITLADAGGGAQCMCPKCRKFDYENALAVERKWLNISRVPKNFNMSQ